VVRGNGARPQVLEEAGVGQGRSVDILVACTDRDEVNILACWIAKRAGVRRVISRARGLEFTDGPTWARDFGIDVMNSPERSVAREILELLFVSSAVHTAELLDGRSGVYAFRVADNSALVGVPLRDLPVLYPQFAAIIVYIEREGKGAVPSGDMVLQAGDLCYLVTSRDQAWKMEEIYQVKKSRPLKKVMIVGGGKLGFQVARRLESQFKSLDIRLIDHNREKCERLAGELKKTLVICGDGADEILLRHEGARRAFFPVDQSTLVATINPWLLKRETKRVPTIPAVKPTLYRLKPWWTDRNAVARGGRMKPADRPAAAPRKILTEGVK
jgi:trk system potassium uptake protein TrkA